MRERERERDNRLRLTGLRLTVSGSKAGQWRVWVDLHGNLAAPIFVEALEKVCQILCADQCGVSIGRLGSPADHSGPVQTMLRGVRLWD